VIVVSVPDRTTELAVAALKALALTGEIEYRDMSAQHL
jgi:hypothetical protein